MRKVITHYDLFAGIGGFSLALDRIFTDATVKHIFCEWESFPAAVLKQHWPDGEYWGDIAELVAHTNGQRPQGRKQYSAHPKAPRTQGAASKYTSIVTGGFPCQPFSEAGRRRGTSDDRYKWPEMFAIVQNVAPNWVIAENVRGLVTWNDGLVLEQVCADLENEGYEVQPLIIPAVAVGAPHRRDRVWIIAHANRAKSAGSKRGSYPEKDSLSKEYRAKNSPSRKSQRTDRNRKADRFELPDWQRTWSETEWMMGYPDGWTELPLVPPSTEKSA